MSLPNFDILHNSLREFAERTNDLVCAANTRLEHLVNEHPPSVLNSLASSTTSPPPSRMRAPSIKRARSLLPQEAPLSSQSIAAPPSLRPRLPIEILDGIIVLLTPQQLLPVVLANTLFLNLARRRLYHTVALHSPSRCVAFLRRVRANLQLPPLVRSLDLNVSTASDRNTQTIPEMLSTSDSVSIGSTTAQPTDNFYRLLSLILHQTVNLTSLTLELPKTHSPLWIFEGCTFKLRQFTTSMHCHRPLARFLETQERIEDLTLRGFESLVFLPMLGGGGIAAATGSSIPSAALSSSFHLIPSALPRLKHFNAIHAGPDIVRAIMDGRPIEVASLPLFADISLRTLNALEMGSVPLKRLSIISFDPNAPGFLFEQLASRFSGLEALHLVMLMADYNQTLLEDSGRLLANFASLKVNSILCGIFIHSSFCAVYHFHGCIFGRSCKYRRRGNRETMASGVSDT